MHAVAEAVSEINLSLESGDSQNLLQTLFSIHAGLSNVQEFNALHYLNVLKAMKISKLEVHYVLHMCMCIYV